MAAKKSSEKVTYLLTMKDETKKRVVVPAHWKVTFGPLVPGDKGAGNGYHGLCLRFYDGTTQKAVFTNVESFRDTSIAIEEEVVKTQSETFYKDTPDGRKQVVVEGAIREWVNPDAPGAKPAPQNKLPTPGVAVRMLEDTI